MSKIILSEHDAFTRITTGLAMAIDGTKMMEAHRPEVAFMWAKMGESLGVCRTSVFKLAEEAATRTMREKGPVKQ